MQRPVIDCKTCDARSISFFKYCTPEEVGVLSQAKSCGHFKKGQILFYEDTMPLGLYCISKGAVKVYKTGRDGKEQIIHFGKKGDFLGYRALIGEEPYTASASALEDTIACFIPKDKFMEVMNGNSWISREMVRSLCHELGIVNERLQSMAQKTVRERLAETLLLLHSTFKQENASDETMINIVLPREDIANLVGTATETIIRLLSEFKQDKLVELEGKKIRIKDENALSRIAEVAI